MHTIAADRTTGAIEVTLSGTMTRDDVVAYMADLRRTMVARRMATDYGIVIDVTACTIQTQDMMRAMGEQMATMPKARAIAIVSTSELARMQIRRLFTQSYARTVATVRDGIAWIVDGREPPTDGVAAQPPRAAAR